MIPAGITKLITRWNKGGVTDGTLEVNSAAVGVRKNNMAAGSAPTGSDNFAAGYAVGSIWHYSGNRYICTGDGVWEQVAFGAITPPDDWMAWQGLR